MKIRITAKQLKKKIPPALIGFACFVIYRGLRITCPFYKLLGIPCAGCGMTSAFKALIHLDIAEAFSHHLMIWAVPILVVYYFLDSPVISRKADMIFIVCMIAGFMINWIINIVTCFI